MGSLDQSCIFDLEDSFTDEISFYENGESGQLESVLVSLSKFSPEAESTKIESNIQDETPSSTHFTSNSLTCVTPMTPTRVNRFIQSESTYNDTIIERDTQCVPHAKVGILERTVEGCEADDARTGVTATRYAKNRPIASSTVNRKDRTIRASRRMSKPRASSTMIEGTEDDAEITKRKRESASIYTWSIDRSSELLFCEDSYMRKMEKKLVPVFGHAAVQCCKMMMSDSVSSGEDTLKYEDGRTSDASSSRGRSSIQNSKSQGSSCISRDTVPLMSSTRRDFHDLSGWDSVCDLRQRPEAVGEEDSDTSRVTPDNPSDVDFSAHQKPTKVSKFNHVFKLRRAKAMASLNTVSPAENSPAKRTLFRAKEAKNNKKSRGVLGRINIMKKLKRFPVSEHAQFQALAVL